MASPQCEHGFTRIANELMDAFLRAGRRLTKREALVWLSIVRLTYGFNRKADFIPVRRIEKMTGIRFDHVHETVWRLKERGLIHLEKKDGRLFLGINKDYSLWFRGKGPGSKQDGHAQGAGDKKGMAQARDVPDPGNKGKEWPLPKTETTLLPDTGTGKLPGLGNNQLTRNGNIKRQKTSLKTSSSSDNGPQGLKAGKKNHLSGREEVFLEWKRIFGTRLPPRLEEKARALLSEIRAGRIVPSRIRLPLKYLNAFEPPRDASISEPVQISAGMKVSYRGRVFEITDGLCIFMEDGLMVEGTIRRLLQTGRMKVIGQKGGK